MSTPKRIVIELADGSRHSAPFNSLSSQTQEELSSLCREQATDHGYVMLEWPDGWKEVVAVDGQAREVLRYYTVERAEEVGRLSLELADGYPELLLIHRLPGRIQHLLFVGREEVQLYGLEEKATVREGGKVEHILYDKKKPNFSREDASAASARYDAVLRDLRAGLEKQGLRASTLLKADDGERVRAYDGLARVLGLRAMERQEDVHGFLTVAMEKLASAE